MRNHSNNFILFILLILLTLALVISTIRTYDRTTWLLEIFPVLIALPILLFTHKKYPLTQSRYGVPRNPITEQELFDLAARVVHLAHALEQNLRNNDLLCRYTFADFLILSSGDLVTITEKLRAISELHGAVVVSVELSGNLVTPNTNKESTKSGRESGLSNALANLEKELVALLR